MPRLPALGDDLRRCWAVLLLAGTLSACGADGPTPTGPAAAPTPSPISVSVSRSPLAAMFVSTNGGTSVFRLAAEVTLVETAGIGIRINQVTTTITTRQTQNGFSTSLAFSVGVSTSLDMAASGRMVYPYAQEFGINAAAEAVSWTFTIAGVDARGRAFTASSPDIPVELVGR